MQRCSISLGIRERQIKTAMRYHLQFSSVQSRPTLCDPVNHSTPGLPLHHQFQVYSNSCPLSRWCHPANLTPVEMAIIKESTNNTFWRGCGDKGTLLHCWWECKLAEPLWGTVLRFLQKLKIELSYDPVIPILRIYLEKTIIQNCSVQHYFPWPEHGSNLNVDRVWIRKMWYIYRMEYYSAMKKNEFHFEWYGWI